MRFSKMILAAAICAAAGCTKSNPLIGKWKLAPGAPPMCSMLDGVEFTDTTMSFNLLGKQSGAVTYSRDGDHYLVNAPNGTMSFEKTSGGIKSVTPMECDLVPAT